MMAICPFCLSALPWNQCTCRWAVYGQRYGLGPARQQFASEIMNDLRDVVTRAKGDEPPAPAIARAPRRIARLLAPAGQCAFCDERRKNDVERVLRSRKRKKGEVVGG
jgi:hypothetical protein